jgi:membrane protein DedA with SNARE-associated domain
MKKIIFLMIFCSSLIWAFDLHSIKDFFSEDNLINLLKEYGYIILFIWSIFEGETGLVMAGVLSYTGDMNLFLSIITAALGGFAGDQIYYYLGKFNKNWVLKELKAHRRKFAKAKLLLRKYGGWVIFIQRFIYGMRTIIPTTIGVLNYNAKKYAIINLISAFIWASITIILSYIFGNQILEFLKWLKEHIYIGGVFILFGVFTIFYFKNTLKREK